MKQELYHWLYQMDLHREHFSNEEAQKSVMLNTVKFYEMVHSKGMAILWNFVDRSFMSLVNFF